jgi:hypothetical protein
MNLRTAIWHMVEEELQHWGKMNAFLWQMDADTRLVQQLARQLRRPTRTHTHPRVSRISCSPNPRRVTASKTRLPREAIGLP